MRKYPAILLALAVCSVLPASVLADTIWVEQVLGDHSLLGTAEITSSLDALVAIQGNLFVDGFNDSLQVDLYRIYIYDPVSFSARTVDAPGFNVNDPQLFLFDAAGNGVYMNDDDESGLSGSQSMLEAGDPLSPVSAGFYYLAIGWWDNEPLDALGQTIFNQFGFGTNGPSGAGPLDGWNGDVLQRPDLEAAYVIELTGVGFESVPEPGSLLLLGSGVAWLVGLGARRSRRECRTGRKARGGVLN
jgi:hypothetical protein